jgi:hypothetical protein
MLVFFVFELVFWRLKPGLSGGKTSEILQLGDSVLPLMGTADGGRLKSRDSSAWPSSFSSFCTSATGSVIVRSKTGRLATTARILSKILLSLQLINVGKRVEMSTYGAGKILEGHHLGVLA